MKPLNVVGDIVFQIFIGLLQLLIKLTLTQLTKKELGKQKTNVNDSYMRRTDNISCQMRTQAEQVSILH